MEIINSETATTSQTPIMTHRKTVLINSTFTSPALLVALLATRRLLMTLVVAIAASSSFGVKAQTSSDSFLTNGLVAYWSFASDTQESLSNDPGFSFGDIAWGTDRFGNDSEALQLSTSVAGLDYYLNLTNDNITVSGWTKLNDDGIMLDGNYYFCAVPFRIARLAPITTPWNLLTRFRMFLSHSDFNHIDYRTEFNSYTNSSMLAFDPDFTSTQPSTTSTHWHQWVVSADQTATSAYFDGVLVGRHPRLPTSSITSDGLHVHFGNEAIVYFNGKLDDFRIYNHSMSDADVTRFFGLESAYPGQPRAAICDVSSVNGFITTISVIDGGYGYTNTPNIRIIGGGGSGATAVATISNGCIVSATVLNPGRNYTSTPTVVVDSPNPPRQAQGQAELVASFVVGAAVTDHGLGYTNVPNVYLVAGGGTGATATAVLFNGCVAEIQIGDPGSGYTTAPTVIVEPPPGIPVSQPQATATIKDGGVLSVVLTSLGSGYGTNTPPVWLSGGGGSGATAVAVVVNGKLIGIAVTSPGSGYTSAPTVVIGDPTIQLIPAVVPSFGNLVVGLHYQLQMSSDLKTWSNSGSVFTATTSSMTLPQLYVDTSTSARQYFRLKLVQ